MSNKGIRATVTQTGSHPFKIGSTIVSTGNEAFGNAGHGLEFKSAKGEYRGLGFFMWPNEYEVIKNDKCLKYFLASIILILLINKVRK